MDTREQINIFIVEDNKIFAQALKAFVENVFEKKSMKLFSFETGEECLKHFTEVLPELVILDYSLNSLSPDAADGLEVLHKIKEINPATSVIMLTSNDHIDVALKSFRRGVSDYIVKTEDVFEKISLSMRQIFADKELLARNMEREKHAVELLITNREIGFQNSEKEKRTAERMIANKALVYQIGEKEKWAAELNIVSSQKAELEKTKLAIEERNKDITDSLNYAKRIQQAKLPRKEEIYSSLPQSFVLFKPKDIVSGDFYFFHKTDESVFIVAADSTGHGVPGAFMSMIGSEKLSEAVALSSDTSEILKHLNRGIKNSLRQSNRDDSTRDGMDIAICSINTKKRIVKYAGASRPFWLIRNGKTEIEEIKGTKKSIGGYTDDDQHFETHELKLMKGDTFYIATDGYADQFGVLHGKKLMTRKLKKILVDIQHKAMEDQHEHLDSFIESWKEGLDQVDDILVIGVRL